MKPIFSILLIGVLVPLAAAQDAEPLRFAKIISDNMVLQQQKPIALWGWAKPGTEVSVTLTQDAKIGKASLSKIADSSDAKQDDEAYSVTMRYVEKNPPKFQTQTLKAKAGGNFTLQEPSLPAFALSVCV